MRLALISDIHSNYHALEAVLADIGGRGVDRIICLGDITLKGPLPKESVDRVRSLGCPVVLGNTDECFRPEHHPNKFPPRNESQVALQADFERHCAALSAADREWLGSFPLTHTAWAEGSRLDLFHAAPHHNYVLVMPWATNGELSQLYPTADTMAVGFGHSHRPFVRYPGGRLAINSGSVGAPYDGNPRASYSLLEASPIGLRAEIRRVEYDGEAAIRAARDVGMAGWELFAHTVRTGRFPG